MKLKIRHIGRVEQADINLNRITIVAGENGSGKSTISKSLFTVLMSSYRPVQNAEQQKKRSEINLVREWVSKFPFVSSKSVMLRKSIQQAFIESDENENKFVEILIPLMKKLMPDIFYNEAQVKEHIASLFREYQQIISKDLDYYIRYGTQLIINRVFQNQINCVREGKQGSIVYENGIAENYILVNNNVIDKIRFEFGNEEVLPVYITTSDLIDSVCDYKSLYSAEKNDMISYPNSHLTRLLVEGPAPERLVAEEYHKLERQKKFFDEMFKQVLDGEIYLEENKLAYHDNWSNAQIDLQNIASGMKIFLILKRLISNGVFLKNVCLIIDEPETNLHPEWQLVLAHLLVLMSIKLNAVIYINSHSPYFVRAMEYYSNQYQILEQCNFYTMKRQKDKGTFDSEEVSQRLGTIYDKLAEPFNRIM